MDISEIRRANLNSLIREAGSRQLFIEKTGKSDAQISQLLSDGKNSRNVGNRLAREFEELMGKEKGWMDTFHPLTFVLHKRASEVREQTGNYGLSDEEALEIADEQEREKYEPPFNPDDYPIEPEHRATKQKVVSIRPEAEMAGPLDAWDSTTPLSPDEVELPLFREVELAAGSGATQVIENHGAKLRFARSTLQRAGVLPEHAACAFVRGNSMEPMMPDGACIGVNTADTEVRDGKIYAIDHGGMLRVKILHRRPGGGVKIVSLNSEEHPPEEYDAQYVKENIRVKGRVFWYSGLL